jgi:hypothetical protein
METTMNIRSVLAATALLAGSIALAGPASAQSTTVYDGADTPASPSDIRQVTLRHQSDQVVVRATFTDLRRSSSAGIRLNIDTDTHRTGPEFALVSGLGDGTDYQLFRVEDWKVTGAAMTCTHQLRLDWAEDFARFTVNRTCLGSPDQVRIGLRMSDDAHEVTDWMLGYRRWTPWMARA